ncbi:high-potential iron-sulfur protein [Novosphingobium sp. BL-8H]|uniref:high-potential iron-sulfur protein n=1 Tax=Novosphingobium sp. BL-8H TaxID=3127640 RepID=UPI0037571BD0
MTMSTRRGFVGLMSAFACTSLASRGLAQAPAVCSDPATLPLSQRSRRRALGYTSPSNDPQKHCSLCAFFTAGAGACGTCQMLSGGAVEATAVCTSFTKKS